MPPNKRTASSTASAPNTPRKAGKSITQTLSTSKPTLLAGNATSKRKASASADGRNVSSQKKAKTGTEARQEMTPSSNTSDEPADDISDGVPFKIDCPAKRLKKNSAAEDAYRGTDGEKFGLEIDYTVTPSRWADLKSFSVIKYQGLELRSGDFAYFANKLVQPEEIPEEEILASSDPLMQERENNFLAMITEARADDRTKVYLRVMYAYWPEELPQGRQPYHGMKEVVMSNLLDILDAHSIVGKVEVARIDDAVDTVDGIYWRQTLDVGKFPPGKGKKPGVLSKLKGHCRCKRPMNPDKTVYICRYCTLWHHDHCLLDDVLGKAWEKHLNGILGQDDDEDTLKVEEDDSIEVIPPEKKKSPMLSSIKSIASNVASGIFGGSGSPAPHAVDAGERAGAGNDIKGAQQLDGPADVKARKTSSSKKFTPKGKKNVRKPGESAPWEGKLSAMIDNTGKFDKTELLVAHIVDEESGETVWTTALSCFGCERRFD